MLLAPTSLIFACSVSSTIIRYPPHPLHLVLQHTCFLPRSAKTKTASLDVITCKLCSVQVATTTTTTPRVGAGKEDVTKKRGLSLMVYQINTIKEVLIGRLYQRRLGAKPNRAHCRALLYCRCVRTWGGVGLVVLVQ